MVNLNKEQLQLIRKLVPEVEKYIKTEDINDLLEALDDRILDFLDEHQELLDENGQLLQKLYDDVFYSN